MTTFSELTERLESLIEHVPDVTEVLELTPPTPEESARRTEAVIDTVGAVTGLDVTPGKRELTDARVVMRLPEGGRAVTFLASGALVVKAGIEPFADLFQDDPGDEALTASLTGWQEKLRISELLPAQDRLDFERLWRIKAAGSDREGTFSEPVLCRAIGSFRHRVRDIPVHGRASATVEVTGGGRLASMSVSTRRFADGADVLIARARTRAPGDAAQEVTKRLARALSGQERDATLEATSFEFGYLSLSRRRPQSVLAPVYLAAVTVSGTEEQERSAHIIAVAGSPEQYLRLPGGVAALSNPRR